jgi:hypothetical protein
MQGWLEAQPNTLPIEMRVFAATSATLARAASPQAAVLRAALAAWVHSYPWPAGSREWIQTAALQSLAASALLGQPPAWIMRSPADPPVVIPAIHRHHGESDAAFRRRIRSTAEQAASMAAALHRSRRGSRAGNLHRDAALAARRLAGASWSALAAHLRGRDPEQAARRAVEAFLPRI